jgi:hypothetical protein
MILGLRETVGWACAWKGTFLAWRGPVVARD